MQGLHIFFQTLFLFYLNKYLGFEALCHMVVSFLTFWGNSIPFFTATTPIYIPTNSAQGFYFLPIFNTLFLALSIIAILTWVRWYLIVVLICMPLNFRKNLRFLVCLLQPLWSSFFFHEIWTLCMRQPFTWGWTWVLSPWFITHAHTRTHIHLILRTVKCRPT